MGRPRGSKNRTTREGTPGAVPARYVQQLKTIKRDLRQIARDLWATDAIIIVGLMASGVQIAISFSYASAMSVGAAIFKAVFIETCVFILNRAISWGAKINLRFSRVLFLWLVLLAVMGVSTRANLTYEYEKKLGEHHGRTCDTAPQKCVPSAANVDEYLGGDEVFDSWLRGGLIPLLVLSMIFARRLLTVGANSFEADESRRIATAGRAAAYRRREE